MWRTYSRLLASLSFSFTSPAAAEDRVTEPREAAIDAWFPHSGGFATSFATGVPFLGISELAYGFGDQAAIGALVGVTPKVVGLGLRPRAGFALGDASRAVFVMPALYYPPGPNPRSAPWVLFRPAALFEARVTGRLRLGLGAGAIIAGPTAALLGEGREERPSPVAYPEDELSADDSFRSWQTVVTSVAFPATSSVALFADAAVVLDDGELAGNDWIGGPPFILALGASTRL